MGTSAPNYHCGVRQGSVRGRQITTFEADVSWVVILTIGTGCSPNILMANKYFSVQTVYNEDRSMHGHLLSAGLTTVQVIQVIH